MTKTMSLFFTDYLKKIHESKEKRKTLLQHIGTQYGLL